MKEMISYQALRSVYSYPEYRSYMKELISQNKSSGEEQTEERIQYTKLNDQRMVRGEKTFVPSEESQRMFAEIQEKQLWLVIAETWCGDASQIIPTLYGLSKLSDKIEFKIVLRDENPELMDRFLTNGARSIPKLIVLQDNGEVLGHWGPRPEQAQAVVDEHKRDPKGTKEEMHVKLHLFYARDRGVSVQQEILKLLSALPV